MTYGSGRGADDEMDLAGQRAEWTWLEAHPGRRQLWVKGRNLTAGDLARTIEVEGWTPEQAADQYDLSVEAVVEVQRYAEIAQDLIAAEEAANRAVARR